MNINIGSIASAAPLSLRRDGVPSTLSFNVDNAFLGFARDAVYKIVPDHTNYWSGHAFYVHTLNDPTNTLTFGFGMDGLRRFFSGGTNGAERFNIEGAENAYLWIGSTNVTGTKDAGVIRYIPSSAADETAGQDFYRSKDLGGLVQDFAKVSGLANDAGFSKRGRYRIRTADAAGVLQIGIDLDYLQNAITYGNVDISVAGKGLKVREGANSRMGTSTLVAGTVTVSNTSMTANTRVFITPTAAGTLNGRLRVSVKSAGASFTVVSSDAGDTASFDWLLVEPSS